MWEWKALLNTPDAQAYGYHFGLESHVFLFPKRLQVFLLLVTGVSGPKFCLIILKSKAIFLLGEWLQHKGHSSLKEPSMIT